MSWLALLGGKILLGGRKLLAWLLEHPAIAIMIVLTANIAFHTFVLDPRLLSQRDDARREANQARVDLGAERTAHRLTKQSYRAAQDEAAALEAERLAQVQAQQKEITDEIVAPYRVRLANLAARAEQLRGELERAGERAAGAPGGERVPGTGAAAGGAAGPAPHHRLPAEQLERDIIATEQALQLNALIDWVEAQSRVQVNVPVPTTASAA